MAEDERAYRRQRRTYRALYPAAGALMKGLLNYRAEPAPKVEGPCLILSNHVTDFDPILVGLSFPEHMYYVAGENVLRMGFLSKHPTTQKPIPSPFINIGINYMNQAVRLWNEIFQIVKDNCSTDYGELSPQDDLMERLLRARKG